MNILIIGGNGFIGRNVVKALNKSNAQLFIGTRKESQGKKGIFTIKLQEMQETTDWLELLRDIDVVVNCVGILRERKNESYEDIHSVAPSVLASACQKLGVRFIHTSALGLSLNAKSQFIQSKYRGEQAVLATGGNAVIVRPSLLDGEGGYGAKWFRRVANWPVHFLMRTEGLIAPLQVEDIGEAIANLCQMPAAELPTIVELGGNEIMDIPQYLTTLRASIGKKQALQFTVPKILVRVVSHIFDMLQWTPLSFGHYELMQGYNAPNINMLPMLLGRKPSELGIAEGTFDNELSELNGIKPV